MTVKNFLRKGVWVLIIFLIIWWLGQYIFIVDGEIDWFRLAMVYGIPIGIPHMFIVIPLHYDVGGSLAMMTFCIVIGGIFGSLIALWIAGRAIYYLLGYPICCIIKKRF